MSTPRHRVFAIALATIYAAAACSGDAANGATSYQQPSPAGENAGRTPDGPAIYPAGTPRLQPGLSQCAGFESWPDAAECLRRMAGEESLRLDRAFAALAGSVDARSRKLLEESQNAWSRLVEADRAIEASIYDPLGPAGYFETVSNDVQRICARAEQFEGWLALTGATTETVTGDTEVEPTPSGGTCLPLQPECISGNGSPERRLDEAYADLAGRLPGDAEELLAQSRKAWTDLQAKDLSFEHSSSLALPKLDKGIRVCERLSRLEDYRFFID